MQVRQDVRDRVLVIHLEREDKRNAINGVMAQGIDAALAMAATICASSPTSVRESLRAVRELTADEDALGWEVTSRAKDVILTSTDMREGIGAFFERREPRWTGR